MSVERFSFHEVVSQIVTLNSTLCCPFPIFSLQRMMEVGGTETRRQHLGPNNADLTFVYSLFPLEKIEILYTISIYYRRQSCTALPSSSVLYFGNSSTCLDVLATFNIHNYFFVKKQPCPWENSVGICLRKEHCAPHTTFLRKCLPFD